METSDLKERLKEGWKTKRAMDDRLQGQLGVFRERMYEDPSSEDELASWFETREFRIQAKLNYHMEKALDTRNAQERRRRRAAAREGLRNVSTHFAGRSRQEPEEARLPPFALPEPRMPQRRFPRNRLREPLRLSLAQLRGRGRRCRRQD